MALAATYGIGIMFSAVVLFLWQGGIYVSAQYIRLPFFNGRAYDGSIDCWWYFNFCIGLIDFRH